MKKATIFITTFAIAFALGAWYTSSLTKEGPSGALLNETTGIVTTYRCDDDKSIWATYGKDGSVSLSLSDGSSITLPHATSASGARYAVSDESIVFWNKGKTAFIERDGETVYKNCVEK
ncbi:MAG: MliC family protein [bacterium]|nr:MliC family protein [bacterium]